MTTITSKSILTQQHRCMGEYSKALLSYEKALAIRQQSLPTNHPDLASSYNNIGNVYDNMGEYSKALLSYEKALAIQQQSLPTNHPDLAYSYNNIGNVYMTTWVNTRKHFCLTKKPLQFDNNHFQRIILIWLLPTTTSVMCIAIMGEHLNALLSYEKALAIRQQSLPTNHPDLASSYNNIGAVYHGLSDYSKACLFYERAVNIAQLSLPSNHPDLEGYRKNLEILKKKLEFAFARKIK